MAMVKKDEPQQRPEIDLTKFTKPFCMVGNGKHDQPFKNKVKTVKHYQRKISRKRKDFKNNLRAERKGKLFGSPKWVITRYMKAKNYTWEEIDFVAFAMTLFAEAKNLKPKDMEMVAKVINNRRKGRSYLNTVTELAQFSSWYYKNQYDNTILLCPGTIYHKLWEKTLKVAHATFQKEHESFKSTHYFAPRNMAPRYRVPAWAKGRYAVGYGGHIFLVDKNFRPEDDEKKVVFIPQNIKKVQIIKGEIKL